METLWAERYLKVFLLYLVFGEYFTFFPGVG